LKQPNLKLKTRPKQVLGSLPLAFGLPEYNYKKFYMVYPPLLQIEKDKMVVFFEINKLKFLINEICCIVAFFVKYKLSLDFVKLKPKTFEKL
jgi:hypothetical protein